MKIRSGFISNSSSSSFLVLFPHKPESAEDVRKMIFDTDEYYEDIYSNENINVDIISDIVWKDILKQTNNYKFISEFIKSLYEHYVGNFHWRFEAKVIESRMYKKLFPRMDDSEFITFMIKSGRIYLFDYGDSGGKIYSAMEHGKLFKRLPHIRESNH